MGVYQPLICGLNLLLLFASTAMIYLGSILINFYLLPSMELISSNFSNVPYLIVSIGVMLLFFSFFGFVAAGSKNRIILAVYAALMGVTFIVQLASIFCTVDFRNELELEEILTHHYSEMDDEMSTYWTDDYVKAKWDTLQRDFQCCGAGGSQGFNTGFKDWERVAAKAYSSSARDYGVPLSCCLIEQSGCAGFGSQIFQDLRPERKIYTHGCMTVIDKRMKRDVHPLLLTYIICAVVLALIEIISVVLASAYVAAISRKSKRTGDRMGMYSKPNDYSKPITSGTGRL